MTAKNDQVPADDGTQKSTLPMRSQNPASDRKLTFPRDRHIRSGSDFDRVFAAKQKAANGKLVIFAARNQLGRTRIGLSVSRRNGNSVVRHRLRRLLREAYRLEQFRIPEGLDLVLIPGRDARTTTQEEFRQAMVFLARRLSAQLPVEVCQAPLPLQGDPP